MRDIRLTLHNQIGLPHWLPEFIRRSGVKFMKVMDPGDQEPYGVEFPDLSWIVRFHEDERTAMGEVMQGTTGAWARLSRLRPELRKRPWLAKSKYALEHMNEPSNAGILFSRGGRIALDYFTAEYTRLLAEEFGIRSCAYNFGVGHPEPHHVPQIFSNGIPTLLKYGGVWSMHEYNYPTVVTWNENGNADTHLTFRHYRIIKELEKMWPAGAQPRIHITEAGIDKLLVGEVGGWKMVNNNMKNYALQLGIYEANCHGLVEAIYIFTATPEDTWRTYEINEADAMVLAEYIRTGVVQ